MVFKIEKDVQLPAGFGRQIYPWNGMEPGDSFFAPLHPGRVRTAAGHISKKNGWKMTVRSVEGGCRVWRIS